MSQIQVLRPGSGPRIRTYVLEKALDLGLRSQIQVPGPRICPRFQVQDLGPFSWKISQVYVLCPRIMSQVLEKFLELGSTSQKRSWVQSVGSRKGLRFRSIIPTFLSYVLVNLLDLGHRSKKCSQIQALPMYLSPRKVILRSQNSTYVLEKVLDLGPRQVPRKGLDLGPGPRIILGLRPMSQDYVLGTGKVPRIRFYFLEKFLVSFQKRSQIQVYYSYIFVLLSKVLDLGHRSKKCSQIQALWFYVPRSWYLGKGPNLGPRIPRFYVLDLVLFLPQVLDFQGPPGFVQENILHLGPRSQNQILGPRKYPRFRFQVSDLVPRSQKMFKILVLFPRFMYQVLEKVLELGARSQKRSQVQFLSSRKCTRFRTQVLNLGPKSQKMSQIQVLRPGSGPRIRTYVLEKALDLGLRSQIQVPGPRICPRFQVQDLGPMSWKMSQIYVLCPRIMSQVLEKFLELGSTSQKRSWVQSVGSRKGLRFRSIIPTFLYYVLVNLLDLGHRSKKCSQIQALCPKKGLQIQFLGPRNVLDLGPSSQKRSQIQVLCPRFMSQVLEKV